MNTTILQLEVETSEVPFIETLLSKLKHSIRVRRLDEVEDENFELTQEDLHALFLQDEISLGSSLMATLGVRVDHHEIFGNETSPRAYLVWQATPELTIKGGYGEAFKAPTLK